MKNSLVIESVDPKTLSSSQLREISEVEKDMWAYGIWEYVICKNCWLIHSKSDIFWHLSSEIRTESVTKLEEIIAWDSIRCNNCNSDTEFIYDVDKNIIEIEKRLFQSKVSFITILQNQDNWNIYGFMDWYVDDLLKIYERELIFHYSKVWFERIEKLIKNKIIWDLPNTFFSFSSVWTHEGFKSFYYIFWLIQKFFNSIPDYYNNFLWITELDSGSNLHWFHNSMWIQKLWLSDCDITKKLIENKSSNYNSDLYIQPWVVATYKERYQGSLKDFIKRNRTLIKEVIA